VTGGGGEAPGRLRRLLLAARLHHERWSTEHELAQAIYGTVVGAAAMAAASLHGTLTDVVVTVLVTVAVYWAAERYAEVLAAAVHGPGRRLGRVARALRRGWPTIEAAYTPLVVLVVFVLITGELGNGVLAALSVSIAMLSGLGYAAARRAGTPRRAALGWAAGSAALGVAVMLLKVSLH
jgi:positive regulator of sigma E activity